MATNLEVNGAALETLMRLGGFKSKREAVDRAVQEAIAWRRQLAVPAILGTIEFLDEPPTVADPVAPA